MSHIGNKLKAGFYATPDTQGDYIKQLLQFTGDCSILDPTAGEGDILHQLVEGEEHHITTYGVELDKGRAEKAKEKVDYLINAPLESMVVSNEQFSMLYLNPPYDYEMRGEDYESVERKEYKFLVQTAKYLTGHGILVYVIPSYRFTDKKIARYLATHFDNVGVFSFSDADYNDFKQSVFIGRKKKGRRKETNQELLKFLLQMNSPEFVEKNVTPLDQVVKHEVTWKVPSGKTDIKTFYTRLESKSEFIEDIAHSKGFQAFKERAKPKNLEIGGNPIINVPQGQMALLLASGAINGLIGKVDKLHAVQGMEIVDKETDEEVNVNKDGSKTTKTTSRTKRDVSVKVITPKGIVKKFV
ncbi:DUF6094 domain-containing protein [Piscibacillus sp. B03]|uniref:DUF6094 domain-containing protein n=1 Tax=Piscibacillus sp. B03 TaxID=3457430 RepID=UPI003FCD68EB